MFKILDEKCKPTRGSKYSACADLYAREDIVIGAGETKIIPLGVKVDLEKLNENLNTEIETFKKSHYLALFIRSSLALKGLTIANGQGVIDLDYDGEIGLIISNNKIDNEKFIIELISSKEAEELVNCGKNKEGYEKMINDLILMNSISIKKGQKVAQCTLMGHKGYLMGIETESERKGGYGSTGI